MKEQIDKVLVKKSWTQRLEELPPRQKCVKRQCGSKAKVVPVEAPKKKRAKVAQEKASQLHV